MEEERMENLSDEQAPDLSNINDALIEEDWSNDSAEMKSGGEAGKHGLDEAWDDEEDLENTEPEKQKAAQSFKLKYMGQEIEVTKDEMIILAQKGKDYDRIRTRADEMAGALKQNSEYMNILDALARKSGMDVDAFVDKTRSTMLKENAADNPPQERRNREIAEFLAEYKDVDPTKIPEDVWSSVRAGRTLLSAYQSYENKLLKAQIEAEKKNIENKSRTTGSRQSSGNARPRGEIEDDWYKED